MHNKINHYMHYKINHYIRYKINRIYKIKLINEISHALRTILVMNKKKNNAMHCSAWNRRDSNPGPIGYEPSALTN